MWGTHVQHDMTQGTHVQHDLTHSHVVLHVCPSLWGTHVQHDMTLTPIVTSRGHVTRQEYTTSRTRKPCHSCEWVMSRCIMICIGHVKKYEYTTSRTRIFISHTYRSRVARVNERWVRVTVMNRSCHRYAYATSRTRILISHTRRSRVTRVNESCHVAYVSIMWMGHVSYVKSPFRRILCVSLRQLHAVMSQMIESCHVMSHVTYECVMSHIAGIFCVCIVKICSHDTYEWEVWGGYH